MMRCRRLSIAQLSARNVKCVVHHSSSSKIEGDVCTTQGGVGFGAVLA